MTDAPVFDAIATTQDGRDITRPYLDALELLEPQDSVLRATGSGLRIYQELLRDDQVWSTFSQRRTAVVSREWEVQPGGHRRIDRTAADHLKAVLGALEWDRITDRMLYAVHYGYAVGECMWARDGRHIGIDDVVVRDRRRFAFDRDQQLRLVTLQAAWEGEPLPARKFWTMIAGADHDDEPYGLGLGHALYWPAYFKREGMRAWLQFLDKYGQPTAKGTYSKAATDDERQKLLAALRAIHTDSGIAIPEGMQIDLLEAARSGTADYTSLYDRMNAAISKVVLGQTMTTDDGSSRAQSQTHMDVRQDLVKADADLVCGSFNRQVARWLRDWNYPDAAVPRVWRILEDAEDLGQRAERESKIATMSGLRPTQRHVEDIYGGEWERAAPTPSGGGAPMPAFAEPGEATVAGPAEQVERLHAEADGVIETWVDQVREVIDAADSLEDAAERLAALDPAEVGVEDFAEVMARALMAAELAGRHDLLEELR